MSWLIASLLLWGIFKGFYEANIFASVFDAIRPEARGTATGFMNMMGWLAGEARRRSWWAFWQTGSG